MYNEADKKRIASIRNLRKLIKGGRRIRVRRLVAHACYPSYSGEPRFQASPGKYFARPYLKKKKKKKPFTKRAGGVAQGIDPEFKPQYGRKAKISTKALQTSKACRGMLGTILYT
jgi:hypothetical protein